MTEKKGVAYIFGIISIVMAIFLPTAGVVFGIIGLVQNKEEKSKKAKKLNIIGIVLGIIFLVLSIILRIYIAYEAMKGGFPVY